MTGQSIPVNNVRHKCCSMLLHLAVIVVAVAILIVTMIITIITLVLSLLLLIQVG